MGNLLLMVFVKASSPIAGNVTQVGDVQEKEAQTADLQKGKIKR